MRTSKGGIINWYESTATINLQGSNSEKQKLTEDLAEYIQETLTNPSQKTASNTSNKGIFIVHDRYTLKGP